MRSVNQQLQIGIPNRDVNLVNRYARGLKSIQPQLMNEDPDLDYYNDTQEIDAALYGVSPYRDVNLGSNWVAMSGDRDIAEEMYEATEEYDNAGGLLGLAYPTCLRADCKECKSKCKDIEGKKWRKGGKECYKECRAVKDQEYQDSFNTDSTLRDDDTPIDDTPIDDTPIDGGGEGMGSGAKIGIGLALVAVLGVVGYMMRKK